MENREDNPLLPLHAVELTQDEKKIIWENITLMTQSQRQKVVRKTSHSHGSNTRWLATGTHRKRTRRRDLYKTWAAALAIVCIGAGGTWMWKNTQTGSGINLANDGVHPSIPTGFDWFNDPGYAYSALHGMAFGVGQVKSNEAGSVKLLGVFCDDNSVNVLYAYTQSHTGSAQNKPQNGPNTRIFLNGHSLGHFSGSSFEYSGNTVYVDFGTNVIAPLPSHFTLDIQTNLYGHKDITWKFKVPVNMMKIREATHVYPIHKIITLGAVGTMFVKSITWGPLTVEVDDNWTHSPGWKPEISLSLVDGLGRVLYSQGEGTYGPTRTMRSGTQAEIVQQQSIRLQSSGPIPPTVGIIPGMTYTRTTQPPSVTVPLRAFPVQMSLGALGRITISHVEYTQQATRVVYRYTGPAPFPLGILEFRSSTGDTLQPKSVKIIARSTGGSGLITMEAMFPAVPSKHGNMIESIRMSTSDPGSHIVSVPLLYSSSPNGVGTIETHDGIYIRTNKPLSSFHLPSSSISYYHGSLEKQNEELSKPGIEAIVRPYGLFVRNDILKNYK